MSKSYSELLAQKPNLKPFSIDVEGLDDQILVHQFTWGQFDKLLGFTGEHSFPKQVLCMLNGAECVDDQEAIAQSEVDALMNIFTVAQVREIYQKCMRGNGFGAEAVRDAEKNSERTQA